MQIKVVPVALGAILLLVGLAAVAVGRTRERQAGPVVQTMPQAAPAGQIMAAAPETAPAGLETATFALG